MSELISGSQTLDDVLHPGIALSLDFVFTGDVPPNPAELLISAAAQELLKSLSAQYDVVLVDTRSNLRALSVSRR